MPEVAIVDIAWITATSGVLAGQEEADVSAMVRTP
jgi:hypothetical protein